MAEFVCHAVGTRGATVISVCAESAHTAESLARHAESCGATAVMAIPPISIAAGEEELLSYYRRIRGIDRHPRHCAGCQRLRSAPSGSWRTGRAAR